MATTMVMAMAMADARAFLRILVFGSKHLSSRAAPNMSLFQM